MIDIKTFEEATDLNNISNGGIKDEVYPSALDVLGEKKLAQVIFTIVNINSWNVWPYLCTWYQRQIRIRFEKI